MDQNVQDTIQRLLAGDETRLSPLLQHYRPRLRRMVAMRTGGQMAARVDPSDVLQDAFIEATKKVTRYIESPKVGFFVWLRGLTQDALFNTKRQHIDAKKRSLAREVNLPTDGSEILARQLVTEPSPVSRMVREESHRIVTSVINGMKQSDQEVILMRHFEGLTNNEVAEALDISPSSATMRHGRALARLKALLEERLRMSSEEER